MMSRIHKSLELVLPAALLGLILLCLVSPALFPIVSPVGGNVLDANAPLFSPGHLLGTDVNGNDIWSRLIYGGRTSMTIAVCVNLIGLCAGGTIGASAGYIGGMADACIMRVLDAFLAFPPLVLVLAIAQVLQPSTSNIVWALAFFSIPAYARVARASTLRLKEQPFMIAALLCGTGMGRILRRHVAPNILPQLIAFALLAMGTVIIVEGAIGFLGFGVPLPQPSWGSMIQQGQMTLSATPAQVLIPSACLFLTVLSFNLLGEALRVRWVQR
jgi:peptide/nickel transport system permease protein